MFLFVLWVYLVCDWFLELWIIFHVVWTRPNVTILVLLFMENQYARCKLFINSSCRFFWNRRNTTDFYFRIWTPLNSLIFLCFVENSWNIYILTFLYFLSSIIIIWPWTWTLINNIPIKPFLLSKSCLPKRNFLVRWQLIISRRRIVVDIFM